jgi:hypothetical protein
VSSCVRGHRDLAVELDLGRSRVPALPVSVWFAVAATVLLLIGLCVATAYVVLRTSARERVARWPARRLVGLAGVTVLPWLIVRLAPIHLVLNIHGLGPLVGWLSLALVAFALLVLLPLATLSCAVVWGLARRRRGPLDRAAT